MNLLATSLVLIEFIIGSTAAVLAYIAWQYRNRPAGTPLFAMAITGIVYMGASVFASTRTDPLLWELARNFLYPLTAAIAVETFYVAVQFTQRREYQHPGVRTLLGGFLSASLVIALTNPVHNLLTTSPRLTAEGTFVVTYEPLFWVHTIIALTIILFSVALLVVELIDADGIYREQIAAIMGGFLIGIVFFLWETIAPVHPAFNLATVGIVGWSFATLWGVARVDLLETAPIARKTLIDSMDDAVFALDTEGRTVDVNSYALDRFNIESEDVGNSVTEVLTEYPPLLEAIKAQQNELEITLKQHGDEQHYHVKKSPVYDTRFRLKQFQKRELQIGQTVVIRNITERKEREQLLKRYERLVENIPSGVYQNTAGPDGTFRLLNDAMVELFDADSKADLREYSVSDLYKNPEKRAEFSEHVVEEGVATGEELKLETLTGDSIWASVTAIARDGEGDTVFDGVIQDITERKEYEQRLERQRDDLEMLNQVLRHDIRNDLQLVTAYGDLLADHVDEEGADYLDTLRNSTEHAVDLTKTARDMADVMISRDDAQQLGTVTLRDTLEKEIDKLESEHTDGHVTVEGSLPAVQVQATQMLDSVFRNLLSNAVQHNDKDVAEIAVSTTTHDESVVVRMADNGPGVPDNQKEEIFGKGEKGLDSEGTGLGLYLVQQLVAQYGGDVWVEDNEPEGAVFVVELPLANKD